MKNAIDVVEDFARGLRHLHDAGPCAVVVVDRLEPAERVVQHPFPRPAPDRLIGGAQIQQLPLRNVEQPIGIADCFRHLPEALLAFAQGRLAGPQGFLDALSLHFGRCPRRKNLQRKTERIGILQRLAAEDADDPLDAPPRIVQGGSRVGLHAVFRQPGVGRKELLHAAGIDAQGVGDDFLTRRTSQVVLDVVQPLPIVVVRQSPNPIAALPLDDAHNRACRVERIGQVPREQPKEGVPRGGGDAYGGGLQQLLVPQGPRLGCLVEQQAGRHAGQGDGRLRLGLNHPLSPGWLRVPASRRANGRFKTRAGITRRRCPSARPSLRVAGPPAALIVVHRAGQGYGLNAFSSLRPL
jgi:hypothetical protein